MCNVAGLPDCTQSQSGAWLDRTITLLPRNLFWARAKAPAKRGQSQPRLVHTNVFAQITHIQLQNKTEQKRRHEPQQKEDYRCQR